MTQSLFSEDASPEELKAWKSILTISGPEALEKELHISPEHVLEKAIQSRDFDLVHSCLSHGAKVTDKIHYAVFFRPSLRMFELTVPAGLDVNYDFERLGGYLLHAAQRGHRETARYLLDQGADPNGNMAMCRWSALSVVAQYQGEDLAELLIQRGARINGSGALGRAARYRRFEMMRFLLLRHGADVNDDGRDCHWFVGRVGFTALHEAADAGHADVVTFLSGNGADPSLKDQNGYTPLMVAQERGHEEVVKLLRSGSG